MRKLPLRGPVDGVDSAPLIPVCVEPLEDRQPIQERQNALDLRGRTRPHQNINQSQPVETTNSTPTCCNSQNYDR